MGKTEIVNRWKAELRSMGFVYRNGMFENLETQNRPVQFAIAIQWNTRSATYRISPTIVMCNPLCEPSKAQVLLSGTLHPDGIHLHQGGSSWWGEQSGAEAIDQLKQHAPGWFEKMGRTDYLAEVLETAIQNRTRPIHIIEPIDEDSYPDWVKDWLPEAPFEQRRVGSMFYYQAAVLHYLNGDTAKAIERTKDWLNSLGPENHSDRLIAILQLRALETRPN